MSGTVEPVNGGVGRSIPGLPAPPVMPGGATLPSPRFGSEARGYADSRKILRARTG